MKEALAPAVAELAIWRDEGLVLPVWWRDDDAMAPSAALDRLFALSKRFGAPLHLAVIPEPALPDLAESVRGCPNVYALPHGWAHRNHAPGDEKKAEFGGHRPVDVMLDEIAAGWRRIGNLFGDRALPIFTPPWNRIAPEAVDGLPATGLRVISTYKPRRIRFAAEGLLRVNVHLDPFARDANGELRNAARLGEKFAGNLRDRRAGRSDGSEPYGLLTHHLMHDETNWSFFEAALEALAESGVSRWTSPLAEIDTP